MHEKQTQRSFATVAILLIAVVLYFAVTITENSSIVAQQTAKRPATEPNKSKTSTGAKNGAPIFSASIPKGLRRIYVSPTGNDLNSGKSLRDALQTAGAALEQAGPGTAICFDAGSYPPLKISGKHGARGKPIMLTAAPGKERQATFSTGKLDAGNPYESPTTSSKGTVTANRRRFQAPTVIATTLVVAPFHFGAFLVSAFLGFSCCSSNGSTTAGTVAGVLGFPLLQLAWIIPAQSSAWLLMVLNSLTWGFFIGVGVSFLMGRRSVRTARES